MFILYLFIHPIGKYMIAISLTMNDKGIIMYHLYYSQNACSLATQVVLHELGHEVEIIDKRGVAHYNKISPTGTVPALKHNDTVLLEGAAIMINILEKQTTPMFPHGTTERSQAIEDIMFANATMHPAYSKLFFILSLDIDDTAKKTALDAAADGVSSLWKVVEQRLQGQKFLGGEHYSAADIMLTVYSRWAPFFPVDILLGERTCELLENISNLTNFQRAIANETKQSAAYEV